MKTIMEILDRKGINVKVIKQKDRIEGVYLIQIDVGKDYLSKDYI